MSNELKDIIRILQKINKFSDASEEEKEKIEQHFKVDRNTILSCEKAGYSVIESIDISIISIKSSFNLEEIQNLLELYKNISGLYNEVYKLDIFKNSENLSEKDINQVKRLFLDGYKIEEIKSAYIVARALDLDIDNIIRKDKKSSIENQLNYLKNQYNKIDIEKMNKILNRYFIDARELSKYIIDNKYKVHEIEKKIIDFQILRSKNKGIEAKVVVDANVVQPNAVQALDATGQEYEKYVYAPFSYIKNNNENININNGSLNFESIDYTLKGINGLGLDIITRYESDSSNLYKSVVKIGEGTGYDYIDDYDYIVVQYGIGSFLGELYNSKEQYDLGIPSATVGGLEPDYDVPPSLVDTYETENEAKIVVNQYPKQSKTLINADPVALEKDYKVVDYYAYYDEYFDETIEIPYSYNYSYNSTTSVTYQEGRNGLGIGWSFGFSSIENDGGYSYLHLANGQVYKINITSTVGDSNLEKYTLNDMRLEMDNGTYSNGEISSAYVLIYKNGNNEYFASDGRLLCIKDRYDNTIKFQHTIIDGYLLITKITDTTGRIVTISYNTTQTGKEVTIITPDNEQIKYILEPIQGYGNEYVLKKKIDQKGRETVFNYSINQAYFSLIDKTASAANPYACLESVIYPTGASSVYSYEKVSGNLGSSGYIEYYRVKTREDRDQGTSYNFKTYTYNENFTGYPANNDPNNLPETFTYKTTVSDARSTITYTFNNKHLLIKEETRDNNSGMLIETNNFYDNNKLLTKKITKKFGQLNSTSEYTIENIYDTNNNGDLIEHIDELGYITSYSYEQNFHQPISIIKKSGGLETEKTQYVINPSNGNIDKMVKVHLVDGQDKSITTNFTYDSFGNALSESLVREDGAIVVKNYEYSPVYKNAYLTRKYINTKDYEGNISTLSESYEYDFNTGLKSAYIDGNGNKTIYIYDNLGRLIETVNPDNSNIVVNYDDINNTTELIKENGCKIKNYYDGLGRLIKKEEINNGNYVTLEERQYNSLGQLNSIKDGRENITSYEYDALGRIIRTINPDSTYTTTLYDDGQNMKTDYNEDGEPHYYYFDKLGRAIREEVLPDKNNPSVKYSTTFEYNNLGSITSKTDVRGNTINYIYDDLGRLIRVQNALGDVTYYEYDSQDNITKITSAGGSITEKSYDEAGRLIKEKDPLGKIEFTKYDSAGNIVNTKDKKGVESVSVYDNRNRAINETKGSIIIINNFDAAGNLLTKTLGDETTTYEYYDNGRLKKETQPDGRFIYYEYDNNGNKTKMIDHFGKETIYSYDSRNRLETVSVDNQTTTYEYCHDGARKATTYPSGIREEYYYNDINNLTQLINKKTDGPVINQFIYTYDENGNQTSKQDKNGVTQYTYDTLNRVETVLNPDSTKTTYLYDKNGNIDKETVSKISSGIKSEVSSVDYVYDSASFRLDHVIRSSAVKLSSLSITPAAVYAKANQVITINITGRMSDGTVIPDTIANTATWTADSSYITLNSIQGKSITAYISTTNWNLMSPSTSIKIRTSIDGITAEAMVYKASISSATLKSLAITPSSTSMSINQTKSFTLSGTMSDGTVAPDSLLNTAEWSVANNFSLSNNTGKTVNVTYGGTVYGESSAHEENASITTSAINPIILPGDTVKELVATIGDISAGADITADGSVALQIDKTALLNSGSDLDNLNSNTVAGLNSTPSDETIYYVYDDNNNLVAQKYGSLSGQTLISYEYNELNQLAKIINSEGATAYTYNPDGLRRAKATDSEVTTFYYDGYNAIIEAVNNNFSARNIYGINPIARQDNSTTLYFLYNGHADVVAMTGIDGNIVNSYDYDIYGKIIEETENGITNPIRYAGQYYDEESSQYYLRARYYDPGLMRFITEDTNKGDVKDPLSLNLYTYCEGNPVRYFDRDGHKKEEINDQDGDGIPSSNNNTGLGTPINTNTEMIGSGGQPSENLNGNLGIKNTGYQNKWTIIEYKGIKVYQRNDIINLKLTDKLGRTNLQRMQQGLAPLGSDGKPINLHHSLQTNEGPIIELTQTFHQQYTRVIHINPNTIPSGIDRIQFDIWRIYYWMSRANELK